jgi:NitT/TauT family transport system substrate-binding protein
MAATGTIRVGWMKLGCISPYFIATANGYWEKRGLKVEHYEFKAGPPMLEAFASDRLDAGYLGNTVVVAAVAKGLPLKLVCGNHLSGMGLVAQPGINTLQDLKGRKIGNAPPGAISDIELRMTLQQGGIDWKKDVSIVTMGYADMGVAMLSKAVDAIASCESYPSYVLEKVQGSKLVAAQINDNFWPGRVGQCCGLTVRMPYADKEKAAMKALLEGQLEAIAFINANRRKSAEIIAKALGTTADAEDAALSHEVVQAEMTLKSIQQHAEAMTELGVLRKAPDMAKHVDNDFWRSVKV